MEWIGYFLILVFCEDYNVLSASCPTTPWKVAVKIGAPILLVVGVVWWRKRRRHLKGGD